MAADGTPSQLPRLQLLAKPLRGTAAAVRPLRQQLCLTVGGSALRPEASHIGLLALRRVPLMRVKV